MLKRQIKSYCIYLHNCIMVPSYFFMTTYVLKTSLNKERYRVMVMRIISDEQNKIETQLKTNRLTKQTILCRVRRSAGWWRAVLRGRLRPQWGRRANVWPLPVFVFIIRTIILKFRNPPFVSAAVAVFSWFVTWAHESVQPRYKPDR